MQYSVYQIRCAIKENAEVHMMSMRSFQPLKWLVSIVRMTDKRFGLMETFMNVENIAPPVGPQEAEIF